MMKNVKENANRYSIQVLTIRGDSRVTNVLQNTMKNEQCLQVGADHPNLKKKTASGHMVLIVELFF